MIRFNRNDSLVNTDFLPPASGFNFTFKVYFNLFKLFQLSVFNVLFKTSNLCVCNWLKDSVSRWAALNIVWIHLNPSEAASAKIQLLVSSLKPCVFFLRCCSSIRSRRSITGWWWSARRAAGRPWPGESCSKPWRGWRAWRASLTSSTPKPSAKTTCTARWTPTHASGPTGSSHTCSESECSSVISALAMTLGSFWPNPNTFLSPVGFWFLTSLATMLAYDAFGKHSPDLTDNWVFTVVLLYYYFHY